MSTHFALSIACGLILTSTLSLRAASWNDESAEETPPRLEYADYNLFYNPLTKTPRNYLLSVRDKIARQDAGFGLHDIPRGGKLDEQVDPKFQGPVPKAFPFADEEIKLRKVGLAKILAFYRDAYTPSDGSPLIGVGDPGDGATTNIGAVEDGTAKHNRFGRLGME